MTTKPLEPISVDKKFDMDTTYPLFYMDKFPENIEQWKALCRTLFQCGGDIALINDSSVFRLKFEEIDGKVVLSYRMVEEKFLSDLKK